MMDYKKQSISFAEDIISAIPSTEVRYGGMVVECPVCDASCTFYDYSSYVRHYGLNDITTHDDNCAYIKAKKFLKEIEEQCNK